MAKMVGWERTATAFTWPTICSVGVIRQIHASIDSIGLFIIAFIGDSNQN